VAFEAEYYPGTAGHLHGDAMRASETPAGKSRVVVVEDHPIVRQGLAALIDSEEDLAVCGQAATAEEALDLVERLKPHVVTLDLTLNGMDGMYLVKEIRTRWPEVLTLVLSMHDETVYAERALRAGARGYVMKAEPLPQIMAAIRKVLSGDIYVSDRFAATLLHRVVGGGRVITQSPIEQLSDRELQVFCCIGQGMRLSEIAERLYVSVKTVEAHREHIKQKLNLRSSGELLRYAIQHCTAGMDRPAATPVAANDTGVMSAE
jgi:DNA-binding NarL/FixJ family response regulator